MKKYYSYEQIHKLIETTANQIQKEYRPDYIISISGGGSIPSRILRTYLKVPILCVGLVLYSNDNTQEGKPKITQWFDTINQENIKGKKVLVVDEVDDTRKTLSCCVKELWKCGVEDIGVMVIHNKIKQKLAKLAIPNEKYFVCEQIEDIWINYPWECNDMNNYDKLYKTE